jgi:hypothetical protein
VYQIFLIKKIIAKSFLLFYCFKDFNSYGVKVVEAYCTKREVWSTKREVLEYQTRSFGVPNAKFWSTKREPTIPKNKFAT